MYYLSSVIIWKEPTDVKMQTHYGEKKTPFSGVLGSSEITILPGCNKSDNH